MTLTGLEEALALLSLVLRALKVYLPAGTSLQVNASGAVVSVPRRLPSAKNCT